MRAYQFVMQWDNGPEGVVLVGNSNKGYFLVGPDISIRSVTGDENSYASFANEPKVKECELPDDVPELLLRLKEARESDSKSATLTAYEAAFQALLPVYTHLQLGCIMSPE